MKTLAILILSTSIAVVSSRADEFASWEWLLPKPVGSHLYALAFDGTRFIAVGEMGVVLTSANGTNWHLAYTDTTNRMYGITVGGGRVLAYGDRATVLVSTNAEYWSAVETGSSAETTVRALAYGNDQYVLLDYTGRVFVSPGGVDGWQESPTPPPGAANDLEFGDGLFVAVGWGGLIATSTNGVAWTERDSGTEGPIWGVAYGDGTWVAVGGEQSTGFILTSFDAVTWFLQVTGTPMYDVAYGPFGFIVTGGGVGGAGVSMNSSDGLYFSDGQPGASGLASAPAGIACGNGLCVAVNSPGQIWTTTNGSNWVSQSSGQELIVSSLATDGATLVGVGGNGTIVSSTDGVEFDSHIVSVNEHYLKVIHAGDRFVALGSQGVVRTSGNGRDWELESTGSTATLKDMAYGHDRTVAIGWNSSGRAYGQFVVREPDGTWQTVWPAVNDYINTRIAFGNGRFVAAAYYGEIWTSTNGLAWQKLNVGTTTKTILPIQFINGRFVGFTSDAIGQSYDGLNWYFTPGTPPAMQQFAYGNGLYVAAGWNWGGIEVSEDLIHWSVRPMKTMDLTSIAYFKDAFYVSGFVLKSASSLVPEIVQFGRNGGSVSFQLFGRIGRDYELQSSTNLNDWNHEQDYTQSARHHPLTLPTGPDQRFYRVKLKEP